MKDQIERFLIHLHRYFLNELIEEKKYLFSFQEIILFTYQHVMVGFFQFEPRKQIGFFNINKTHH